MIQQYVIIELTADQALKLMRKMHQDGQRFTFRLRDFQNDYPQIMIRLPRHCYVQIRGHGELLAYFDARNKPREMKE